MIIRLRIRSGSYFAPCFLERGRANLERFFFILRKLSNKYDSALYIMMLKGEKSNDLLMVRDL